MNRLDQLERKLEQLWTEPDQPQLFYEIGVQLLQFQDWKNAERYLKRAFELRSSDEEILNDYVKVLCVQFKWREAVSVLASFLGGNPESAGVMEHLGGLYYLLGEYETAAEYMNQVKELKGVRQTCMKESS